MSKYSRLAFRLRQEAADLWLLVSKPSPHICDAATPLAALPDPAPVVQRLRGTPFALELEKIAERICRHEFPLLGLTIATGPEIDWRRDYVSGITSGTSYCRAVPYLDFARVGDHKVIWELNRHQHLVLLAQAWLLSSQEEFLQEIQRQLESWWKANPFLRGINWASALEVAFRVLSWLWVYHLAGPQFPPDLRRDMLASLYQHGLYLRHNFSLHFSPNTHLLGEGVALHALGKAFPEFPDARYWEQLGSEAVSRQMKFQIQEDGSHFEHSAYYHVYALDMFLFHRVMAGQGSGLDDGLWKMAAYLAKLQGPHGLLPLLGDDDGGRLFHPYGRRDRFGRATLATCGQLLKNTDWVLSGDDVPEQAAWWLGAGAIERARRPEASFETTRSPDRGQLFADSGVAVMGAGDLHVIFDAGPFGWGTGGHSHSDTLSLLVRFGDEEILIDPGTFTYVSDAALRNWFRGSAAHNTIRPDGRDQGTIGGPFRWEEKPVVRLLQWTSNKRHDLAHASCGYGGFTHERRVLLLKQQQNTAGCRLVVFDEMYAPPGDHSFEQFWHFGSAPKPLGPHCYRIGTRCRMVLPAGDETSLSEGGVNGWRSTAFGERHPAPVLRIDRTSAAPARFCVVLDFSNAPGAPSLKVDPSESLRACYYSDQGALTTIRFDVEGLPVYYGTGTESR